MFLSFGARSRSYGKRGSAIAVICNRSDLIAGSCKYGTSKEMNPFRKTSLYCRHEDFYYSASLRFGGWKLWTRLLSYKFSPIKSQIGRILFFLVATEEGRFSTRINMTVPKTLFENRWLRKTRLATSPLMLKAIQSALE